MCAGIAAERTAAMQTYLLTYGVVNLACLLLDVVGVVNFRPTFSECCRARLRMTCAGCIRRGACTSEFYNKWVCLLGFVGCVFTMFAINVKTAFATLGGYIAICLIILYRKIPNQCARSNRPAAPDASHPGGCSQVGRGPSSAHVPPVAPPAAQAGPGRLRWPGAHPSQRSARPVAIVPQNRDHVKYWRPQVQLLARPGTDALHLSEAAGRASRWRCGVR